MITGSPGLKTSRRSTSSSETVLIEQNDLLEQQVERLEQQLTARTERVEALEQRVAELEAAGAARDETIATLREELGSNVIRRIRCWSDGCSHAVDARTVGRACDQHGRSIAAGNGYRLKTASVAMPTYKSTDPDDRMGVFRRLEHVPEHRRFEQFELDYRGRDVWSEFVASKSNAYKEYRWQVLEKAGTSWKDHISDRGRHHALARPDDIATWTEQLVPSRTFQTVHNHYLAQVEQFYDWLQFHTEHPHVYQPVLMAVAEDETTRAVWMSKFDDEAEGGDADE